jgi:CPA1 family monovalent cation:H+ antiporter
MNAYALIALILSIALLIGFFNAKVLKLQTSIAMMLSAMIISTALLVLQQSDVLILNTEHLQIVKDIHFSQLLLNCLLGFLLFAGALTIDIDALREQRFEIALLASFSTLASAALVAVASHYLLNLVGVRLPWIDACLFGALISPTDPIAVLATFKKLGAPRFLKASVAGESLFNDGVGIVIFTTFFMLLTHEGTPTVSHVVSLFLQQAVGGILYGMVLGVIALWLCRQTNDDKLILLTTLAVVTGGYTLALNLGISGPLAMVVTGIWIGHGLRKTNHFHFLETIWEAIDDVLNAILFLLLGFELLDFSIPNHVLEASLLAIPLVLFIRWITVIPPLKVLQSARHRPGFVNLLTWGGLRGGLAIALALSLPASQIRDIILTLTYGIVAFSVIIQGVTIRPLVRRYYPADKACVKTAKK